MHPTLSRYLDRISGLSTARTAKGVLTFVRKNPGVLAAKPVKAATPAQWKAREESRKWSTEPAWNNSLSLRASEIAIDDPKHSRKRNWCTPVPRVYTVVLGSVSAEDFRYKGKFSGYRGSRYYAQYNSYFRIARNSGGVCEYYADNVLSRRRLAPKGLRFDVDGLGVRVVDIASGADYHFGVEDFSRKDFVFFVRREIATKKRLQANSRKEEAKRQELEKALGNPKKLAKVWVTREDSLRSGNCIVGTDRFIELAFSDSSGIGAARADWLMEKWPSPAVVSAVRRALIRSSV